MSLLPKDKNYIKLVYEEVNNGFGKACNIGARQTSSEYILFLNPDTVINEFSIDGAIDLMTKESSSNIFFLSDLISSSFFLINFLYFDQYDLPMISLKYSKFK